MDGEDARVVGARKRGLDPRERGLVRDAGGAPELDLTVDEGVGLALPEAPRKAPRSRREVLGDAHPELGGRRLREGDDEKLMDRNLRLDDEAQREVLDREGLARPG